LDAIPKAADNIARGGDRVEEADLRSSPLVRALARPWLPLILGLSALLRLAAALWLGDVVIELPGTADQISYHTLALRLLDGHGFTFSQPWWPMTAANAATAHWSYLYTFYLTGVYALFGPHPLVARLIQALIVGILHPLLAYLLAMRLFHDSRVGLVAAALTAVYAYFVYYSATLMTEPFYITAILASLYLAILLADRLTHPLNPPLNLNPNPPLNLNLTHPGPHPRPSRPSPPTLPPLHPLPSSLALVGHPAPIISSIPNT